MSRTRQPIASNSFQTTTESSDSSTAHFPPTLRLRAEEATDTSEATSSSRRIRWSEDVIDNEGMGKKSSKGKDIIHLHLFHLPAMTPQNHQQQSNRHQYAASTTKPAQWEKVAQKSPHPAHPKARARVKTTVALPESTGLAAHTHTPETGNRTTSTKGVVLRTTAQNRNAVAGSRVRMHTRRCLSRRRARVRIRMRTRRGVLDLYFMGGWLFDWQGNAMRDKAELGNAWGLLVGFGLGARCTARRII